jgi:beta-N-acetylhexosaminidase
VRRDAEQAGARVRSAGVRMVLHPSADLGVAGGPAELRAFSDDPREAAARVRAAVDGWTDADVLPAPGRFPGEGAASQDPLAGPATVGLSLDELMQRDVQPFLAVAQRAPAIQMSAALYAAWDGVTPATLLPEAVDLLRGPVGFDGAVVSADLVSVTAATGESVGAAAVQALKAGCDVLLVPGARSDREEAYRALLDAVEGGELSRARIDEALLQVLSLKRRVGLAGS